jgi:hypothetical protein
MPDVLDRGVTTPVVAEALGVGEALEERRLGPAIRFVTLCHGLFAPPAF